MDIEIKNIKINKSFSEETICFTADVYVNGVKTAYARNDGRGGCTYYCSYHKPNNDHDLRQAEAYAKSLPSTTHEFGGRTMILEMDLERLIDDAVYKKFNDGEKAKFDKTLAKHMETDICFGVPNSGSYKRIGYGKHPLKAVCLTQRAKVQELVDRIRREHCKDGVEILNTNLAELGLK